MSVLEPGYALRPEIIESAYYLYHYTHESRYQEMGRSFFEGIRKYCRTDSGYTVLKSVVTKEKGDLMPSYFLAETLKYLYLLFEPKALNFDEVVFNTEAHPLRRVAVKTGSVGAHVRKLQSLAGVELHDVEMRREIEILRDAESRMARSQ
jgi:mannosidase alpha-like ER degradation enhancer 2